MEPEKDQPPEVVEARVELMRQFLFVVGILLCLGGSYIAITEAFGDRTYCSSLGCFDASNPEDIWLGVVMVAAGAALSVKMYQRH